MLSSFEIKTYPQLQFALGAVNVVLLASLLIVGYSFALTPSHQGEVDALLARISSNKLVALAPLMLLALVWSWLATQLLRLHDRIHEPHIRKWRAIYDADFILRAVLKPLQKRTPDELFQRAYEQKRLRQKFLQRLFFNFVGDSTTTAAGQLLFFYGAMWRYWTLALLDIYLVGGLLVVACYAAVMKTLLEPKLVGLLVLVDVLARKWSNVVLDSAHELTIEQIAAIHREHAAELESALDEVLKDQGLGARG